MVLAVKKTNALCWSEEEAQKSLCHISLETFCSRPRPRAIKTSKFFHPFQDRKKDISSFTTVMHS